MKKLDVEKDGVFLTILGLAYGCIVTIVILGCYSLYMTWTESPNSKHIEQLRYVTGHTTTIKSVKHESSNDVIKTSDGHEFRLHYNSENLTDKKLKKGDEIRYKKQRDMYYIVKAGG